MSTIYVSPQNALGHVYVDLNVADLGDDVDCVQLVRINADGTEHIVRPAVGVCTDLGEWQKLSAGRAVMWDVEAPLDQSFTYRVELENPPVTSVRDTFTRTIADGGGIADSGQAYVVGQLYSDGCSDPVAVRTTSNGYVETPDAAALDVAGDIDLRADVILTNWSSASVQLLVGKYDTTGNQRAYRLYMEAGLIKLGWSADGIAGTIAACDTVVTPPASGRLAVRATMDVDDGAGNRVIRFYTAATIDGTWTAIGSTVTTAGTTSIFNSTTPLRVGRTPTGSQLNGFVYAAQVLNGIGGTVVANPRFMDQATGAASFVDSTGLTWTLNGDAVIVASCVVHGVSVNGSSLVIATDPIRDHVWAALTEPVLAAVDVIADVLVSPLPVVGNAEVWVYPRRIEDANQDGLFVAVIVTPAGAVSLELRTRIAGVNTVVDGPVAMTETMAAAPLRVRTKIVQVGLNETWTAKLWDPTAAEPGAWDVTEGPTIFPEAVGSVEVGLHLSTAVTNSPKLYVSYLTADGTPFAVTSTPHTLVSGGSLWLRDPLTPCNDVQVGLCWPPRPDCVAGDDVFFAALDVENYASQGSAFAPNDAARPIAVTRKRRDADTNLTVVARTFTARERLTQLLAPGNVLQLVGGDLWGLPDRYMDVQDVGVGRLHVDHRYEPRVVSMPYVTEDRPVGPGAGVCGARVTDLCDGGLLSWAAITAAGLTWAQIVAGAAGASPPTVYARTYAQIDALGDYTAIAGHGSYEAIVAGA